MKIAVIGGGISGLATAYHLSKTAEVVLFESGDRVGGNIRTEEFEGARVEWGPNGFLDNEPATRALVDELGLRSRVVRAREAAATRMIWRAGKLRALPESPRKFLTSDCLPLLARLRVLWEPRAAGPPGGDESVRDFAVRRIGRGAADVLVDAFVTGIFAGDPAKLSLASALPKLAQLESNYGSLFRGMKARGAVGVGPGGTLTSFDEGLEVLTRTLAERIDVRLGSRLKTLEVEGFDQVVCTAPAQKAAALAEEPLAGALRAIPTAPVAVVAILMREPLDVPDVFGFLAPHGEGLGILGTLYDSSIFPGRAPEGLRLFRTMVGGRREPEAAAATDEELLGRVARVLHRVWGRFPEPQSVKVIRHPLGIPQYETGHAARLARIDEHTPAGVRLAGSSYRGVSLNACVKEALDWSP